MKKLISLIESLSKEEQQRLVDNLRPVVEARKAYLDFALIQIPKDFKALADIEAKRTPLLQPDEDAEKEQERVEKLTKLDKQVEVARAKIHGTPVDGWVKDSHEAIRIQLTNIFKKAKERFAGTY